MNRKSIIISGLCFLFAGNTFAQQKNVAADTIIKSSTIEITQIYQPKIKEAVKETYNPSLPVADHKLPHYQYEVPDQSLNYNYKPQPLQALAATTDTISKGYKNYVKAGIGNLRTLYLDAGTSSIKVKNFNSEVHFGMLSQKGSLAYQRQTVAALSMDANYWSKKMVTDINLNLTHNNFFQYGYDDGLQPNKIATRQTLSGGDARVNFYQQRNTKLNPSLFIKLSGYTGNNISSENTGMLGVSLYKSNSNGFLARLSAYGSATHLSSEFYSVNNNFAAVKGGFEYKKDKLRLKAYLEPTVGQHNNTYLLNDIEAKFHFDKAQFNIGAGTEGKLTQNTYKQLFLLNPYISTFPSVQSHSNEVFAFVDKGIGHHISINARASWWQYENLATFLNGPGMNPEKMSVSYIPKVNALSLQFGMRYQIGNAISVGTQLVLYNYNNIIGNDKVWHMPNKRLNADLLWNPLPELSLTAYSSYVGGNFAMDSALHTVKLKPYLDMGFGAEYLVMKKLSLFLNCNNLLNNKYQRWQGYQSYGINIYGGVRLKF